MNNGQQTYSPYLMPISNYYTGSSSTVSATITRSPSSPYQYTHYYTQAENNMPSSSIQDQKVLKTPNSIINNIKMANLTNDADETATAAAEDRLAKQLQLALLYNQLLALQQYRTALYGSTAGSGLTGYSGYQYGFPNTISSLYNYLAGQDMNLELSPTTSASSSIASSSTGGSNTGSSETKNTVSATNGKEVQEDLPSLSDETQLQALSSLLSYRQQLASMYGGGMYGSGLGSSYGTGPGSSLSSLYGGGLGKGGFGYPSTLYGSSYGSIGGNSMGGSSFSSLYGSAMPTGVGGIMSSLAGGLSSLTGGSGFGTGSVGSGRGGGGLGVLNSLGTMLFG